MTPPRSIFGIGRALAAGNFSGGRGGEDGASPRRALTDEVQFLAITPSIAKSWAGVPQVRNVVIPPGTPLFVPVMGTGSWATVNEGGILSKWDSFDEWLNTRPTSTMKDLEITIDGRPVAALEDGNPHYLHYFGADGFDGGEFPTAPYWGDGLDYEYIGYEIALLLAPLPPGDHVITMKGQGYNGFESDVTYHLTVKPGKK